MLDANKTQLIVRLHKEGYSQRVIADIVGVHRSTVRRYCEDPKRGLSKKSVRPRTSKLDIFDRDYLSNLFVKTRGNFHVIARILTLKRKDENDTAFSIDPSSVRRYYQKHLPGISKPVPPEINFFEVQPGQQLQIDFVECKFRFKNKTTDDHLYLFEAVYAWSRKRYIRICPDTRQSSWYLSILDCIAKLGCPRTILCDNDKSLVISHGRGGVRFNPAFIWLCKPLGIAPQACKPRHAKTKGRVERTGYYIKQNALAEAAARGTIENSEQLQRFLDIWVSEVSDKKVYRVDNQKRTAKELYEVERQYLHFVAPENRQMLNVFSGCRLVSERGEILVHAWKKTIGYRYRGRFVNCYIRPDGACLVTDLAGHPIVSFSIPVRHIQNYAFDAGALEPPKTNTGQDRPYQDAYLDDLTNILGQ